jgi:hypothetical protein
MQMFKGSGQKRDTSAAKARGTNAAANRLAPVVLKRPKKAAGKHRHRCIWTFYDLPLFHPCVPSITIESWTLLLLCF